MNWRHWVICIAFVLALSHSTTGASATTSSPRRAVVAEPLPLIEPTQARATDDPLLREAIALRMDRVRDPETARKRLDELLTKARQLGRGDVEVQVLIGLGAIERQYNHVDQAIVLLDRATVLARTLNDPALLGNAIGMLGRTLAYDGIYAESLDLQRQALKLHEQGDFPGHTIRTLIGLGNTLGDMGDDSAALEHYERTLDLVEKTHDTYYLGTTLNNLGLYRINLRQFDAALPLIERAIAQHQSTNNRVGLAHAYLFRGYAEAGLGRHDAALADLQRAESLAAQTSLAAVIAEAPLKMGDVWLSRAKVLEGDSRSYALLNAERETRKALVKAEEADLANQRIECKWQLVDILIARNDTQNAASLLREVRDDQSALDRNEDRARLAIARARYDNQRAEAEMRDLREREAQRETELERSRAMFWGAFGFGIAALVGVAAMFWVARVRRTQAQALRQQGDILQVALEQAERNNREAEAAAALNQRLLALAGADLQAPLADIRTQAERLLATHANHPDLSRALATLARTAGDSLKLVQHIHETAASDQGNSVAPTFDIARGLRQSMADAEPRSRQRRQRVRFDGPDEVAVRGHEPTLTPLCAELIDLMLRHNPADCELRIGVTVAGTRAVVTLSDRDGHLKSMLTDGSAINTGASGDSSSARIGVGLLRENVAYLGGTLESVPAQSPDTGHWLRFELPLAA